MTTKPMFRHLPRLLLLLLLPVLSGGCGTTVSMMMRSSGEVDVLYPATLMDLGVAYGSVFGSPAQGPSLDVFSGNPLLLPLAIADLPISLVSDTLFLPRDIHRIYIRPEGRLPFILRIHDDDDNPVANATVTGYGGRRIHGHSRADGTYLLWRGIRQGGGHFRVDKEGYYPSRGEINHDRAELAALAVAARTPPKVVFTNITLRPIVNPIPMYARKVETRIPEAGRAFGFDLVASDWIAPAGSGTVADVIFRVDGTRIDYRNYDATLTIAFPNTHDGMQSTSVAAERRHGVRNGSEYLLPRHAPVTKYERIRRWHRARAMGDCHKDDITDELESDQNHFFRIRSLSDASGSLVAALYGKIQENLKFELPHEKSQGVWLSFTYYLNPTPNDRNMEFDPSRNLFKKLKSIEQVHEP